MLSEHERAVRLALQSGDELKRLVNRLGTSEAPRGRVLSAYRQARRAMRQVDGLAGVVQVLTELRVTVEAAVRAVMAGAVVAGEGQARTELAVYGLPNAGTGGYAAQAELDAWLATLDAQLSAARGLYVATGDVGQVVGDDERAGVLSPAPVVRDGARWLGIALGGAWAAAVTTALVRGRRDDFMRQAVAAIDERTTDCCLRVHGQVVGMADEFHLTGTPRFGAYIRNPPFHHYCRTSTCLVRREDADDRLSVEMREAARNEIDARDATGVRVEIHPADARSGR